MVTNYDIDKLLYRSFKTAIVTAAGASSPIIPITGEVFNGNRPLDSCGEDITIRTMSVVGDGYPQDAVTNVNVYVNDIAESHGGYVRNGARLDALSSAVADYIRTLNYPNVEVAVDTISEVQLEAVHQHFVNFRLRVYVYGDLTTN